MIDVFLKWCYILMLKINVDLQHRLRFDLVNWLVASVAIDFLIGLKVSEWVWYLCSIILMQLLKRSAFGWITNFSKRLASFVRNFALTFEKIWPSFCKQFHQVFEKLSSDLVKLGFENKRKISHKTGQPFRKVGKMAAERLYQRKMESWHPFPLYL